VKSLLLADAGEMNSAKETLLMLEPEMMVGFAVGNPHLLSDVNTPDTTDDCTSRKFTRLLREVSPMAFLNVVMRLLFFNYSNLYFIIILHRLSPNHLSEYSLLLTSNTQAGSNTSVQTAEDGF